MGNLRRLPGTDLTPEALLRDLLEDVDGIAGIAVVVVQRGTGRMYSGWTKMDGGASCAAAVVLLRDVGNSLCIEEEEVDDHDNVG